LQINQSTPRGAGEFIVSTDLKTALEPEVGIGEYQFGFHDSTDKYVFTARKGLDREIVEKISEIKNEPAWMREFRLQALDIFFKKPMPKWGGDLSHLNFQDIHYYVRASANQEKNWDDVPEEIRKTYDRLGIPEAEKKYLAGVKAQYESEVVYGSLQEDLAKQGVLFTDTDSALRDHPDLFREYFGKVIPSSDNKFAALNSAVWSGGSFIYVPKGVQIDFPLQAYFRINSENMGQFERTLIIVDEGASVHYVEGCTAPTYSSESLHSAVVEIIVKRGARCRYTTIQNWSNNVYNLVTKRAMAYGDSLMEWVDGNLGSRLTMKYPAIYLMEPGARGETLSIAFAGKGQHQDAGAKMVHCAPNTYSRIISKSISKAGGRASYRGLAKVVNGAKHCKSNVVCDALILDSQSRSDTYPYIEIDEDDVTIEHEASVSKISEEQLFYLRSRGLSEAEASSMIVTGFIEPLVKELPMEYAVEMNRLIELQMEGSVG
jgi:Fe-S cluster assembly protein SufB